MSIEMSITTILWGLFLLILFTAGIIHLAKLFFKKQEGKNLTALHKNEHWKSPLQGRNKYPEVNTFLLSGAFMNYGLIVALVLMIFAFSWTTYEAKMDMSQYIGTLTDEIEMETPRTTEPPTPPVPPPPAPKAMEIVANDLPDVEAIVFHDQSISEETAIEAPVVAKSKKLAPPPPPPPPPVAESEQEIFRIVEQNPTFPGCEDVMDKNERQKCAEEKMLQFIYSNIVYPPVARDNGVQGTVVLQFVVEKDGRITNITIVRNVGGGCGDEARNVVSRMPKWNPGRQRERPVRVQFTLPVKFVLE